MTNIEQADILPFRRPYINHYFRRALLLCDNLSSLMNMDPKNISADSFTIGSNTFIDGTLAVTLSVQKTDKAGNVASEFTYKIPQDPTTKEYLQYKSALSEGSNIIWVEASDELHPQLQNFLQEIEEMFGLEPAEVVALDTEACNIEGRAIRSPHMSKLLRSMTGIPQYQHPHAANQ